MIKEFTSQAIVALLATMCFAYPVNAIDKNSDSTTIMRWSNINYMNFSNTCYSILNIMNKRGEFGDPISPWEIRMYCNCSANHYEKIFTHSEVEQLTERPNDDFIEITESIGRECLENLAPRE